VGWVKRRQALRKSWRSSKDAEMDGEECMEVTHETLETSNQEASVEESNAMIESNAKTTRSSEDNGHDYDITVEVEGPADQLNTQVNIADDAMVENTKKFLKADEDFTEAKTLFEGSFIENYEAILKTLKMFPEAEIKDDDCTSPRNLLITEPHPQTDKERSLCCVYSSMFRNIILMHCVVSTVYTVYRVFLVALVKLAEQGRDHKPVGKTEFQPLVLDLLDWTEVDNADYQADELDNNPVHKMQEDLLDKSEKCMAKQMYLVDAIHTDQVPGMLNTEERRTYFNHRLACSQINYLRYLKMIPLVAVPADDLSKLACSTCYSQYLPRIPRARWKVLCCLTCTSTTELTDILAKNTNLRDKI